MAKNRPDLLTEYNPANSIYIKGEKKKNVKGS
jgi:hypothetical protein